MYWLDVIAIPKNDPIAFTFFRGYMSMPGGWLQTAFGWSSAYADLFYNIADAINKIGFGLIVYSIAVSSREAEGVTA